MKQRSAVLASALLAVGIGLAVAWWAADEGLPTSRPRVESTSSVAPKVEQRAQPQLETPKQASSPTTTESDSLTVVSRVVVTESPAAKLARMTRTMKDLAAAENWDKLYSGLGKAELKAEQSKAESSIVNATSAYLEHQFAAGQCETLDERVARTEEPNPFEIQWKRFEAGKPARRCVAPEAQFADAYKLRMLSVWLGQQAFALQDNVAKR
jgi:hypothetical protein